MDYGDGGDGCGHVVGDVDVGGGFVGDGDDHDR